MTPTLLVQLYGGPDDGDEVPATQALPRVIRVKYGLRGHYLRDHSLDLVRADGTPVHRYRWHHSPPPGQAET